MAGIIKLDGLHTKHGDTRPVAFNLQDMNDKASAVLENVQARADAILQQARRRAEFIQKHAQEQGRAAAVEAAKNALRDELNQRLQTLTPALNDAIQQVDHVKQAWLKRWENAVVHLGVKIAERIARRQVEQTPEITAEIIQETLQTAAGSQRLVLHLSPADHEALGDQIETIAAQFSNLAPTDIIPDPAVTPGGCVLNSEFGQIDQTLEAQLARIEEELIQ